MVKIENKVFHSIILSRA